MQSASRVAQSKNSYDFLAQFEELRAIFCFEIGWQSKGELSELLFDLQKSGFIRLISHGQTVHLADDDRQKVASHFEASGHAFVVVDRLKVGRGQELDRLAQSLATAFDHIDETGRGSAIVMVQSSESIVSDVIVVSDEKVSVDGVVYSVHRFSNSLRCEHCKIDYPTSEPRLFNFNSPLGACATCEGFGEVVAIDMNKVVPDMSLSLSEGAIAVWRTPAYSHELDELRNIATEIGIPFDIPVSKLKPKQWRLIHEGVPERKFGGLNGFFAWLERKKYKMHVRVFLAKYRGYTRCPDCGGGRLRREAQCVKIAGQSLPEVCARSIKDANVFFNELQLSVEQHAIADRLLHEIKQRLKFLVDVGLDYLTLARLAATLSGGEAQRIQLATNLGASLVGALYVLDEPSIGLHPRDSERLIKLLENLRNIGNTVLVVEHEAEMMRAADYILDIGPGAGELGGQVVYEGDYDGLLAHATSLTGRYLRGEMQIKAPNGHRAVVAKKQIEVKGLRQNNLKNINVTIPLGMLVCITGVSGSGKSTLIHDCLYAGIKHERGDWRGAVGEFRSLDGGHFVDDIILVDQSPIGRTPRSNPVTYIKVYDAIREAFAETNEAKKRGYNPSHFSFNVPGGRCDACEGDGTVTVEMQFLADVELICEECRGSRFKSSILDIKYRGKSIYEVLNMTVREAMSFFSTINRVANKLRVLEEVGLGYLRLGQSATTLSGGEAQRVKLASYLSKRSGDHSLFIFDEPTTGLHFDDINKLLGAFRRLIEAGGSLVVIEHNLDVIKTADWIIDLGPEGGDKGGHIVAVGTPEQVMQVKGSYTGRFLQKHLQNNLSASDEKPKNPSDDK